MIYFVINIKKMEDIISKAFENRELLEDEKIQKSIFSVIDQLNNGTIRVAEPKGDNWIVNEWVKKAILLYFAITKTKKIEMGPLEFNDKIPLKSGYDKLNVRVVPTGIARYGSYLAPGVVLMPGYVNIGAYVDSGTMIDTWVTVGSCAQIGKNVHLSGGVGIGGVLEPIQANPVIIENNCFIGSRSIIVEGARICEGAVIAAGTIITASTHIIDVTKSEPIEYKGYVPPRSIVISGTYSKQFPAGIYNLPCALIIGERKESTDIKTQLNDILRDKM
jgi:2,3,4,5-tetrahydropyridine-2-carboxylate N-succinyltransferase